jgi:hypothetical protein
MGSDHANTNNDHQELSTDQDTAEEIQDLSDSESRKFIESFKLNIFAEELDRRGISDRDGAALASAILQDLGLITIDNRVLVVDRSKVRRARKRIRNDFSKDHTPPKQNFGLFFDGKKDHTTALVKKDGKNYMTKVVEDHYVLVKEPNSEYLGHVTVPNGQASTIASEIFTYLETEEIDKSLINAIGSDGTNVNTGCHNGVIRRIEIGINRPLQWFTTYERITFTPSAGAS